MTREPAQDSGWLDENGNKIPLVRLTGITFPGNGVDNDDYTDFDDK